MAAGALAKPGTKFGPCEGTCAHRDCDQTRITAARSCHICTKPIGYETRFYREDDGRLAHAVCLEDQIERERAA